jgi:hypothetical protein
MIYNITWKYDTDNKEWIVECKEHPHMSFIHENFEKAIEGLVELLEDVNEHYKEV